MKPLDPRLIKYAKRTRKYIFFVAIMGAITTALVLAQAFFISWAATPVISHNWQINQVSIWIIALVVVLITKFLIITLQEALAHRAAHSIIIELRQKVITKAIQLGDRWISNGKISPTVTLVTRGLDNLEPYFVRYLPQLFLSCTVTPLVTLVILWEDWVSALFVVFCIPLIPIFMILIGLLTQSFASDKLAMMQKIGASLIDLLAGLPTLKAFGRETSPGLSVAKIGRSYTRTTMQTLRVAFISGAALEFIAILCTALVAVEVGFRMVYGYIDLTSGLIIIMLTPEVYKPLREVGSQFHASADGIAAANQAFEILETPIPTPQIQPNSNTNQIFDNIDLSQSYLEIRNITVQAPGRIVLAPYEINATIHPGQITALVGASGSGKTTTVQVLLKLLSAKTGQVKVHSPQGCFELQDIPQTTWWKHCLWVPQRPAILPGTVLSNLAYCNQKYHLEDSTNHLQPNPELLEAAKQTGFIEVVEQLPNGWHTQIGTDGVGLSLGQRQRLALTRALASDAQIIIIDEPTAHIDAYNEKFVLHTVKLLRQANKHVIVIAHRNSLKKIADQQILVMHKTLNTTHNLKTDSNASHLSHIEEIESEYLINSDLKISSSQLNSESKGGK